MLNTPFKHEFKSFRDFLHPPIRTLTNIKTEESDTEPPVGNEILSGLPIRVKEPRNDPDQPDRYGLKWIEVGSSTSPAWTIAPNRSTMKEMSKQIADMVLDLPAPADVDDFTIRRMDIGESAISRYYIVDPSFTEHHKELERESGADCADTELFNLVFQVSLPVNPYCKTMNDHATLAWLDRNTEVPITQVLAMNARNQDDNALRFEWMCCSVTPGTTFSKDWDCLTFHGKKLVIKQLAKFLAEIFHSKLEGIGSLCSDVKPGIDLDPADSKFSVGPIATVPFFMRDRINYKKAARGPFNTSREWLRAQLEIVQLECDQRLSRIYDAGSSDRKHIQDTSDLIKRLLHSMHHFIPDTDDGSKEQTTLFCPNLNMKSIMIDEEAKITAIPFWEDTACFPAWAACDVPALLRLIPRWTMPDKKDHALGKDDAEYKKQVKKHELTKLRFHFLDRMKRNSPSWIEMHVKGAIPRDFRVAVEFCDYQPLHDSINRWLDTLEEKGFPAEPDAYVPLSSCYDSKVDHLL